MALTIHSMSPFDASGSATVDKQTCGCTGTGTVTLSVVVEADAVPAAFKLLTGEICVSLDGEVSSDDESECCEESGGGSACGTDGCAAPTTSGMPIRYATGEVVLRAVDLMLDGYGVPWGHTLRFQSRLNFNENLGNGFNWQVKHWRHVVEKTDGSVLVQGAAAACFGSC